MQRERNILFILLALIFALFATIAIYYYMRNYEQKIISESGMTVPVIASTVDVAAGTEIRDYMIAEMQWPKKKVLPDHIMDKNDVLGKVVKIPLAKDMPIMRSVLLKKGDNLSYFVPEKMRAMTLEFDDKTSNTSFVRPGVYVDILATFNAKGTAPFTKTILQGVKVVAVNGKTQSDFDPVQEKKVNDITVLIPPQETERLALAKSQAKINIVLRNISDDEQV